MLEFLKTVRIVGLKRLFNLSRSHRRFWSDTISGYYSTQVINTLLTIGFFEALQAKGRVRLTDFAETDNLDHGTLLILCDYLFCIGLLDKRDDNYRLTKDGKLLVEFAKGWFEATIGYEDVYYHLTDIVRKKKVYGKDLYRKPILIDGGSGKMESFIFYPLVIDQIGRRKYKTVLDLGCGNAEFLIELCQKNAQVSTYGLDISSPSIANARERVRELGLDKRITLFCQDIIQLKKPPENMREPDAVTIFFALHEILYHGQKAAIDVLNSLRRLFPKVPIIVFEVNRASLAETRKSRGMSAQYYLQHDLTQQKLIGHEQWTALFRKAGFTSIEERNLKFAKASMFTLS